MVVKSLEINGFRNLRRFSIRFAAQKNLIHGANGSGKTSIIEALFLLGFGRSFLSANRRELINFNASGFFLSAEVLNISGENVISALQEKGFCLKLNGEKVPLPEVGRHLFPLFFSSFSYNHHIDHVPYFRKMVDRFIYGLFPLYLNDLLRYNTILKQKNTLLKNLGNKINHTQISSWDSLLAETGCRIVGQRADFIRRLNESLDALFNGEARINYFPALLTPLPTTRDSLLRDLERMRTAEGKSRRCLIGPQRDRFEVLVFGRRLPLFSTGEKKKYLLLVYMAFIELFRLARDEYPVFLIDDYDAAMDEENVQYLLDHFPDVQVIATSVARNERFGRLFELKKES
ncbi:MAG: DNA replication and repair protein RecF [Candidatus Aminicenantes bacterium]|nr:DNA replication and repair protein RecF [Candidatus Aminicenantes bacterium]